jgi:HK97 family phage major capsid protein
VSSLNNTRLRLERLADERQRTNEKIEDMVKLAEDEQRDLVEHEQQQVDRYRNRLGELEEEIAGYAADLERAAASRDVSALIRRGDQTPASAPQGNGNGSYSGGGEVAHRTFAQFARDELIVRYPLIANAAGGAQMGAVEQAQERLQRTIQNTTSSNVAGLITPAHIAEIMDLINKGRPVVSSGRQVNLSSGQLTYPVIAQRPTVLKQAAEKTEAGTANMQVTLTTITADTYLGAGDLSWQTITWSNPDALSLWFDLAAEAYARQTETAACSELGTAGGGTATLKLGTAGTEDFAAWRAVVMGGLAAIYTTTGGRAKTDTMYLSADKFFQLAGLGTASTLQISSVGGLDVSSMSGNYSGLRVIGSYGFSANTAILGDGSAFLVGENQGAPVEMRAVEPTIGGMQVGVIGAFKAKVFDPNRFIHIA